MGPGATVVGYAVATGVGGIVGHLLTAVEFALLGIDGVDVGWSCACIGIFINLFTTDVFLNISFHPDTR